MDPRLQNLSYSSQLVLHSCPRKYELDKKNAVERDMDDEVAVTQNVTFAFGHIVGSGIQDVLAGKSETQVIWGMYLGWHADLEHSDDKKLKSFYYAVYAVQKFISMRNAGLLDGYELVYYEGKPACELSFRITFPNGFKYRGYVDAVLRHKETGKVLVLELKTTGMKYVKAATYKNSAQAIGYSIVLDVIFPTLSSYEVLYLVYMTTQLEYEAMPFTKSYLQRALWIRELLLDIDLIEMYDKAGVFPMHGESCLAWGRECSYFGTCTLSTEHLVTETPKEMKKETYQIELTLADLIQSQLSKTVV